MTIASYPRETSNPEYGVATEARAKSETDSLSHSLFIKGASLRKWTDGGFYRMLVESLQDGLAIIRDGGIVFANSSLAAMLGYEARQLIGQSLSDLILAEDLPEALDRHHRRIAGETVPTDFELRMRRRDGEAMSAQISATRFTDADGEAAVLVSVRDVTEKEQTAHALAAAEARFRGIFENAVEGIYQTSPEGSYLAVNPALASIYGYDSTTDLIVGLTDIAHQLYVDPAQRDRFTAALAGNIVVQNFEAEVYRKDGTAIWISENARRVCAEDGRLLYYEGTVQDITARKQAEESLRLSAKVFESVAEAIAVIDANAMVQAVNGAFERMTGRKSCDCIGRPLRLIAEDRHGAFMGQIRETVRTGGMWQGEVRADRNSGETFPAWLSVAGVKAEDGEIRTYVVLCSDITQRKLAEQKIRFQAGHDMVTRLANRRTVMERLEQAIDEARDNDLSVLVLFIDLNRFKYVNDSFGHAAGDRLLQLASRRLANCVRMNDTVGRIGGDEFVIVLPNVADHRAGLAVAEKILYAFSDPFTVAGHELFSTPSIGVAAFPNDGGSGEELLSNADAAMYHAKKSGGKPLCFFHAGMTQQAMERLTLENDLRLALERREFTLHYQPKWDMESNRIIGAEALIRWKHPTAGYISPATFIPLAEEAGLVIRIGQWTLWEACIQLKEWRDDGIDLPCISVNLSPGQFNDSNLISTVREVLEQTGLPPRSLDLEITETMVAAEVEKALAVLNELKGMGVGLSVDDFGTGYSSLSYLKTFPVDTLKIDRSFVRELPANQKDGAIVSSIIALAQNLGFEVIAEGVEEASQAEFLRQKGCRQIQGYYYSRPVDPGSFAAFYRKTQNAKPH